MEWAYRNDYPDEVPLSEISDIGKAEELEIARKDNMDNNDPLLCHIRVYIFADTYLISGLKSLSYKKLTEQLKIVGKPRNLDSQAVIQLLDLAFSNLMGEDDLLDWLGKYAAWCLGELRQQPDFHHIASKLAPSIVRYAEPRSSAPWNSEFPKARRLMQGF